jgi:PadR family transcriptional regulator, regulatory protein AphA
MSPMTRRSPGIELAILGFLLQGPQHGYQLHQMILDPLGLGKIWYIKQSQLYALLSKLEKDGYISAEVIFTEDARPPRRMVQLTASGKAVFDTWVRTPVNALRLMRQEFMAKYYFAVQEGAQVPQTLLNAQRDTCQQWLKKMELENTEPLSFQWQVRQYRQGQIKAALDWLDNCEEQLSKTK